MVDASAATPVLRTISMAIPHAHARAAEVPGPPAGSYLFVGGAPAEMLVTVSVTGAVLGAAVDHRIGGGAIQTAAQWQGGDAENAMDHWAEMSASQLVSLTSGKRAG